MPKYIVYWSKVYYASGEEVVEAESADEAEDIVRDNLGDYTGSMQYDPDSDYVECYGGMVP